jgi:hypothetical protein
MYLISFYWSFTTMTTVGFGDITGSTGIEQGFSIFAMGIGGFTFALIVGGIGDLITRDGVAETAYLQMMGELKEFLFSKSVPKDLGARVVAFHERLYSNRTVFDEQKIFERLPEMLRSEVVLHMYGGVMRRVPLFHALTDRTLADVCLELKAYHATTGEAFTVEGERADKMFVIKSGMVRGFPNHHVPPTDGPDCPDCLLTVWSTGPTLSNPSNTWPYKTDTFFLSYQCVLMDPTGAIRCTVSKDVVALDPKAFRKGAALLLKEVPVLTVAEYTEHYLCVTQHELIQAFAPDETEVTESAEEIMEQEERMEGGGICPNINPSRTQPKRIGNVPSTHTNETEHEWFPEPRGSGRPPETLAREMHDAMQRVEAAAKELDEVCAGEMVSRRGNDERDKNQQENFEPAPLERAPDPDPTEPKDTTGEVSAFARAAANLLRRDD